MLFSSNTFLYVFLPLVVAAYFLAPWRARNAVLLVGSLLFYSWGELTWTWVLLVSITWNWLWGGAIGEPGSRSVPVRRALLAVCIAGNLACLGWFKYAGFLITNLNSALHLGVPNPGTQHLPLGISFFTFHSISYIVDIHRGEMKPQRHLVRLALYICLFPQLIAGPIVRYKEIGDQIDARRRVRIEDLSVGATRFVRGLAKKVLIANPCGGFADTAFTLAAADRTSAVAWVGVLAYSLQIYFDFSGYSDMAIGLARVFGFRFPENFNHPYVARSIQDFWRRWHMSLSRWFRDYLYIPLGGNRLGPARTYLNLYIVFVLCGFWHGASWGFVLWGFIHGSFLALERSARIQRLLAATPTPLLHAYTLFVVAMAWVLFRAPSLSAAVDYYGTLVGAHTSDAALGLGAYLDTYTALVLVAGAILAVPLRRATVRRVRAGLPSLVAYARPVAVGGLLAVCMVRLAADTYNPFIYFRF